jgi:hypothetical protein
MPRFSIGRLLISTAVISLGLTFLMLANKAAHERNPSGIAVLILAAQSFSLIGAGFFNVFRAPRIGALVGLLLFILVFVLSIATADF